MSVQTATVPALQFRRVHQAPARREMRWAAEATQEYAKLSWADKISLYFGYRIFVRKERLVEDPEVPATDLYLFCCSKHGPRIDYSHGYRDYMICDACG